MNKSFARVTLLLYYGCLAIGMILQKNDLSIDTIKVRTILPEDTFKVSKKIHNVP